MSMRSRGTSNVGAIVDPCTGWGKLNLVGSDKGSRDSATSRSESSSESRPTKRGPVTARRRPNTARAPNKAMPRDRRGLAPEDYLAHALQAKTAAARANWAQRGLAHRGSLEPTTKAMLLRQLYLAFYASGHFQKAYEIALQMVGLGVLEDVVQQDCARAIHAAGDIDLAVGHLRLAARQAPASRRAFHWWTLGSLLFLAGRHPDAIAAFSRAARWGTRDKPLYRGHLALAKLGAGIQIRGISQLIVKLADCPAGQGYGRFVLGHLAYHADRWDDARAYLTRFVERTARGHAAMAMALRGEVEMARATLASMQKAS